MPADAKRHWQVWGTRWLAATFPARVALLQVSVVVCRYLSGGTAPATMFRVTHLYVS